MKTLIYRNQQPIDEFENKLNEAVVKVDQAYQLFRKAPYAQKSHTIIDVLQNYDSIVQSYKLKQIEQMKPGSFALEGIQLSKNKLADLIHVEEPEGLRSAIFEANQIISGSGLDHFVIKYNKVIINKALFDKFVDKHSIYARTAKDQQFLQKYEDLGNSLVEFAQILKTDCDLQLLPKPLAPLHIGLWFDLDEKGRYKVKPQKFELLAKRMLTKK